MRYNNKIILIFILFISIQQEIKPQNNLKSGWFNFGVSRVLSNDNRGLLNVGMNVNWKYGSYTNSAGLNFTSPLLGSNNFIATVNYGIGYSYFVKRMLFGSFNIGPSASIGKTYNDATKNSQSFWGLGISLDSQFYISPLFFIIPNVALGIEPYLNYNFYESVRTDMNYIYGVRFCFNINDIDK